VDISILLARIFREYQKKFRDWWRLLTSIPILNSVKFIHIVGWAALYMLSKAVFRVFSFNFYYIYQFRTVK